MNTEDKFHSIYKRYFPLMRVLARKGGIPYDEIDDIVQDTFISFYSHYPSTWPDYRVKAMLVRIVKNRCVDYLRKKENRYEICFDPARMQEEIFGSKEARERDSLTILLGRMEYEEVMNAILSMRREWIEIIELSAIEGRPIDEVSEILNLSEAACRQRLCRARKHLREYMQQKENQYRTADTKTNDRTERESAHKGEVPGNA